MVGGVTKSFVGYIPPETVMEFRENCNTCSFLHRYILYLRYIAKILKCPESISTISSIKQCWDDDILLSNLSSKFLEFSFKVRMQFLP